MIIQYPIPYLVGNEGYKRNRKGVVERKGWEEKGAKWEKWETLA